jgi:hypothetical protein
VHVQRVLADGRIVDQGIDRAECGLDGFDERWPAAASLMSTEP